MSTRTTTATKHYLGAAPTSPKGRDNTPWEPSQGPYQEIILDGRHYYLVPAEATLDVSQGRALSRPEAPPDPAAEDAIRGLSEREVSIVRLVASGLVNKQIALELQISEHTVSTYLRRVFAKLGVDTRAAMVSQFLAARGRR